MDEKQFGGLYQRVEVVSENQRTIVLKAQRAEDKKAVILKTTTNPYPSAAEIAFIAQEYQLLNDIGTDYIPHALDLFYLEKRPYLVMENFGGISLENYLKEHKLSLARFLEIGIELATLLITIHEKNVMHKDIHPDNILLRADTGEVMIIDFGLAIRMEREHSFHQHVNMLTGTFMYMSPEQTGRMNRFIDSRTDLYSLGLCFYKMLTGKPPFDTNDPVELVYCQVAKDPDCEPLYQADIPEPVISIIKKLTDKLADNRYQSARGLLADLNYCFGFVSEGKPIEAFAPGAQDIVLKLRIPEKIYGRDLEIEKLFSIYKLVCQGESHLLLVDGFAGIGKSALIYEVHKPNVGANGFFVSGKFEQYKSNQPFFGFARAFSELVRNVLSEPPNILEYYKHTISRVLGANVSVLMQLVPELSVLLGKREELYALNLEESKNRFFFAIKDFIRVFASGEHPLTIFLDDLQWCDDSSLALLNELCHTHLPYVLIIGAYRSNEVHVGHPLRQSIDKLKGAQEIFEIHLDALKPTDVNELLANTLFSPVDAVSQLSAIVYKHTAGNPFYISEFLKNIYSKGLLNADHRTGKWSFDLLAINALEVSANVIDIISQRVMELPEQCRNIVEIASCIGFRFGLKNLSLITGKAADELSELMWPAIADEIIYPLSEKYKLLTTDDDLGVAYTFQHDRIHQAVYQGMEPATRMDLHYRIGHLLLEKYSKEEIDEYVIEVVSHLNEAIPLVNDGAEKNVIATLNCKAGEKAQASVAYFAARDYFFKGIQQLEPGAWKDQYALAYPLYFGYAQNAYQTGSTEEAEKVIEQLLQNATTNLDYAQVLSMRLRQYTTLGKSEEAIRQGIIGLARLGIQLPENPGAFQVLKEVISIKLALKGRRASDLLQQPEMKDPEKKLSARLLSEIGPAAYPLGKDNLYALTSLRVVSLSLQYGNCGESSFAYATYGAVLGEAFGDYESAEAFGKLAVDVNQKLDNIEYRCRVIAAYGTLIHHFSRHWSETTQWYKKAVEAGYQSGDLFFLAYSAAATSFWDPNLELSASLKEQEEYLQLIKEIGYVDAICIKQLYVQYTKNLLGLTNAPGSLNDNEFDQQACYDLMVSRKFYTGIATYSILMANVCMDEGDYEKAWHYVETAKGYKKSLVSNIFLIKLCMVTCFTAFEKYRKASAPGRVKLRWEIFTQIKKMKKWADFNPVNFGHLLSVMKAEWESIQHNQSKAAFHYEEAIRQAKKNNWLSHLAFCNERAARHYFSNNLYTAGAFFMAQAIVQYKSWGAVSKINKLQDVYQEWLGPGKLTSFSTAEKKPASLDNVSGGSDNIDLASIIKTSQAISGEIVLESLLRKMIGIITMNAGAELGVFLINNDESLFIQASFSGGEVAAMQNIPLIEGSDLPLSVINYVSHLKQSVVLADASVSGDFTRDPYFQAKHTKSVICSPVILLSNLYGIIYLENNKLSGAFTEDRLVVLNLLSSQMAISIHNALLYGNLEEKVSARTNELSQSLKQLQATQSQLIQSEKMASLGELAAGIAHEIKNPLNFVNNFSEVNSELLEELLEELNKGDLEEVRSILNDLRENEEKINFHGKRADSIIKGMLSHSRSSTGKKELTNLNALADEYLRLAYHGLRAKDKSFNAEYFFEPDKHLPEMNLAPQEIGRVLLNLINNAFYAVNKRHKLEKEGFQPVVRVSTKALFSPSLPGIPVDKRKLMGVEISVQDNGTGMSETVKEKIFQPFFTTKPTGEGTGLGLSLSFDIVTKGHGGDIRVDSKENEGTTFIVWIPVSIE